MRTEHAVDIPGNADIVELDGELDQKPFTFFTKIPQPLHQTRWFAVITSSECLTRDPWPISHKSITVIPRPKLLPTLPSISPFLADSHEHWRAAEIALPGHMRAPATVSAEHG